MAGSYNESTSGREPFQCWPSGTDEYDSYLRVAAQLEDCLSQLYRNATTQHLLIDHLGKPTIICLLSASPKEGDAKVVEEAVKQKVLLSKASFQFAASSFQVLGKYKEIVGVGHSIGRNGWEKSGSIGWFLKGAGPDNPNRYIVTVGHIFAEPNSESAKSAEASTAIHSPASVDMAAEREAAKTNTEVTKKLLEDRKREREARGEDTSTDDPSESALRRQNNSYLHKISFLDEMEREELTALGELEHCFFGSSDDKLIDLSIIRVTNEQRIGDNTVGDCEVNKVANMSDVSGKNHDTVKLGRSTGRTTGLLGTTTVFNNLPGFPDQRLSFPVITNKDADTPFCQVGDSGGGISVSDMAIGIVQGFTTVEAGDYAGQSLTVFLPLETALGFAKERWGLDLELL